MLCLNRRVGERVLVKPTTWVEILDIRRGEVVLRIGNSTHTLDYDEVITLGETKLCLVQTRDLSCKLGFDAPKSIAIVREELHKEPA